jgi:hypothetical protein
MRIAYAVLFTNGMVMVIDEHGEQVPDMQGPYGENVGAIIDAIGEGQEMILAQWATEYEPLPWRELARFVPVRIR